MSRNVDYDDRQLQQLFAELEPKRRLQAVKGGFRKEANYIRKTAIHNLRGSIRSDKDLERGVRALVFKKKAGFRVTIGTKKANKSGKGEAGFHTNRRGLKKPVLIWAEEGTKERKTKSKSRWYVRKKRQHYTGRMPKYGFMAKTLEQVRDSVTNNIHDLVVKEVIRVSNKYGCK